MNWLLALPILLPVASAALMMAVPSRSFQRIFNILSTLALFVCALLLLREVLLHGIQASHFGNWRPPFAISFVADTLGATMVAITGLMGFLVAVFGLAEMTRDHERLGFYPLYQILLMGVCGAFLTVDLFNLFVWFEVMLMASFVLLVLGNKRAQLEGGIKYLVLNFLASSLFLAATGILYAKTGTLNMADMAQLLRDKELSLTVMTAAMLLLVAFGVKAAVFPLFSWLPASYHTPPVTVSAIFAALLTKVGVYALIRSLTLIFENEAPYLQGMLIWISVLTMVTGVLGAAAQFEIRRILSVHIVSQIGYMTLGLAFFTEAAIAAAVFYIIHNILVKTNLFLVGGAVQHLKGTGELKKIGGLYKNHPWLAVLFLISAMSLGGIPPLSGFLGKLLLVREGVDLAQWAAVAFALGVGILTLYSMTKIWAEAFWKADPESGTHPHRSIPPAMIFSMVAMTLVIVSISIHPQWLISLSERAAYELKNPELYINAVLGSRSP